MADQSGTQLPVHRSAVRWARLTLLRSTVTAQCKPSSNKFPPRLHHRCKNVLLQFLLLSLFALLIIPAFVFLKIDKTAKTDQQITMQEELISDDDIRH